ARVNTNTIQMKLNGTPVAASITQTNQAGTNLVTFVQYQVSSWLPAGSSNTVVVSFLDTQVSPASYSKSFSFIVATNYPTIPANYAATVDPSSIGFTQRVFQGGTATLNSIANAETLLGGFLINPANGQP